MRRIGVPSLSGRVSYAGTVRPMDRREALRRLAAGGAVTVGGSVIVSQPALAYTNPVVTGSPTVSINTTGDLTAQIVIGSLPTATCPASAISKPTPTQISLTWETFWPGNGQIMSTGSGTDVSIPRSFQRWFVDDRIRVTTVYRYRCVYSGRTAEVCIRWFREFRVASGGGSTATWALVAGSSTGPTTVACPAALARSSQLSPVVYAPGGRTEDGTPND